MSREVGRWPRAAASGFVAADLGFDGGRTSWRLFSARMRLSLFSLTDQPGCSARSFADERENQSGARGRGTVFVFADSVALLRREWAALLAGFSGRPRRLCLAARRPLHSLQSQLELESGAAVRRGRTARATAYVHNRPSGELSGAVRALSPSIHIHIQLVSRSVFKYPGRLVKQVCSALFNLLMTAVSSGPNLRLAIPAQTLVPFSVMSSSSDVVILALGVVLAGLYLFKDSIFSSKSSSGPIVPSKALANGSGNPRDFVAKIKEAVCHVFLSSCF